ncbi:MAG: RNA polymerase-associated protein RapA [Xanthomonadales bacterium]|nr:RNA polymerase-associated protein RapA [Xanthomonadales bacterium]
MAVFVPGQRWFSIAEPELGLGTVMRLSGRSVQIVFTGSGLIRQYAVDSAPMLRAEFQPGERIRIDGREWVVASVERVDGVLHYLTGDHRFAEGQLDAEQPVSQADQRLLSGRVDRNDQFDFRFKCLRRRARARAHPGWGLLGARVDLIPHQLRIAEIAATRRPPRLLLADEVGLGKTIEACLILAQALASGRAERVLILVPESLVHQWFVELLRRFNLAFAIFDEERCEAIAAESPGRNPFEEEQLVIASTAWLADDDERQTQLRRAGWDLLVVDEAHHLEWHADTASSGYRLVESLAESTPGLILLTATPEQLGIDGHFARLRLLDPARFCSLAGFRAESARYLRLSRLVDILERGDSPEASDMEMLAQLFSGEETDLTGRLGRIANGDARAREELVDALIDRHGTGRVMIRNRRRVVGGFPKRRKAISALAAGDDPTLPGRLLAEMLADWGPAWWGEGERHAEPEHDYRDDPRLHWLLDVLDRLDNDKLLLICRSRAKVQAIEDALRLRSGMQVARFHEGMSLLQRDRNAAFFADPDGARLLLSSEAGAEGRNFQFAHHLLLWDLPPDPDQLEQRIGRIDRIGQRHDVVIHAAAINGSPQALQLRWFDEGLDALENICADGRELLRDFGAELLKLCRDSVDQGPRDDLFDDLLQRSRERHAALAQAIASGRDHLLELASQRGASAGLLLSALSTEDQAARSDDFPLRLLEQFGIHHESLSPGVWVLDPEYVTHDAFDAFKEGPRSACLDRELAMARDDLLFLRLDQPLMLGAMDLLLSGETGNAAFLIDDSLPPRTVILEAVFVLECIADRRLNTDRFLPPVPLHVALDTRRQRRDDFQPDSAALRRASNRQIDLGRFRPILKKLLPPMLEMAEDAAREEATSRASAAAEIAAQWGRVERERLVALSRINASVREEEVAALDSELAALAQALPRARPRLDALRLVASPDFLSLRT